MTIKRSIWKGSFIDACLVKMREKPELIENEKIFSRGSTILPEWVDRVVRIHNGQTHVKVKITEAKVGHKFGEFAITRKARKPMVAEKKPKPGKKK